jgi:hypothetical protein
MASMLGQSAETCVFGRGSICPVGQGQPALASMKPLMDTGSRTGALIMTIAMRNTQPTDPTTLGEQWVEEKGLPHHGHGHTVADLGDRIVVATDLGPVSQPVEERAMEEAEAAGASLVVAAVVAPGADTARLADIAREARNRGIETETRVASGDPVDALLDVASSVGATGIVVSDDQWRGTIPHPCICAPLIRLASCPVLVLHESPEHACQLPA